MQAPPPSQPTDAPPPLTISAYQEMVKRTCVTTDPGETVVLALIGLCDELGEVAGPIKKHLWHGHPLDVAHVREEIGNVCWYLATLCIALGIRFEDALAGNAAKLARRYPDDFSSERSLHRQESDQQDQDADQE
jgi:NTP pyrophosphatase (non-canonical NTP hydrolase)